MRTALSFRLLRTSLQLPSVAIPHGIKPYRLSHTVVKRSMVNCDEVSVWSHDSWVSMRKSTLDSLLPTSLTVSSLLISTSGWCWTWMASPHSGPSTHSRLRVRFGFFNRRFCTVAYIPYLSIPEISFCHLPSLLLRVPFEHKCGAVYKEQEHCHISSFTRNSRRTSTDAWGSPCLTVHSPDIASSAFHPAGGWLYDEI